MGIEAEVLAAFLERLKNTEEVPADVTAQLGALLAGEKLPKADELASLFTAASGEAMA